jgi:hypothetical protein
MTVMCFISALQVLAWYYPQYDTMEELHRGEVRRILLCEWGIRLAEQKITVQNSRMHDPREIKHAQGGGEVLSGLHKMANPQRQSHEGWQNCRSHYRFRGAAPTAAVETVCVCLWHEYSVRG